MEVANFIDFLATKANKYKNNDQIPKPKFGSGKDIFVIHKDFDNSLDDFKELTD